MRIRALAGLAGAALLTVASSAHAISISFTPPSTNVAPAQAAEAAFLAGLTSATTENFESYGIGQVGYLSPFTTSVGDFQQVTPGTIGGACATLASCNGLWILNNGASPFSGRYSIPGGTHWLDSNDSQNLIFTLTPGYRSVGFYLTDPNDAGGLLQITASNGISVVVSFSNIFGTSLPSGSVSYVSLTDPNGIASINFLSNAPNDGFGIDNVSIGDPVPEPGTLLLLGGGLLGLGRRFRRKP